MWSRCRLSGRGFRRRPGRCRSLVGRRGGRVRPFGLGVVEGWQLGGLLLFGGWFVLFYLAEVQSLPNSAALFSAMDFVE